MLQFGGLKILYKLAQLWTSPIARVITVVARTRFIHRITITYALVRHCSALASAKLPTLSRRRQ